MTTAAEAAEQELEDAIEAFNGYAPAILDSLGADGWRLRRQAQVGWLGPYGLIPGGMDVDPVPGWLPVWRDADLGVPVAGQPCLRRPGTEPISVADLRPVLEDLLRARTELSNLCRTDLRPAVALGALQLAADRLSYLGVSV